MTTPLGPWLALLGALALAGCARAPAAGVIDGHTMSFPSPQRPSFEPLVAWSPRPLSPREAFRFGARPTVLSMQAIDYAALDVQAANPKRADTVRFALVERYRGALLTTKADVLLEVEGGSSARLGPGDEPLAMSGDPLAGLGGCPSFAHKTVRASGIRRGSLSASELELMELSGKVDPKTCRGDAKASEWATARALVEGRLYAFRRCLSRCEGDDPRRREELVLVGPPAHWVASSAALDQQTRSHEGAFALVSVPVSRGGSASATMLVEARDLAKFVGLRGEEPSWSRSSLALGESLAYTVELSWPEGADQPDAMLYVSKATPMASELLAD